MQNYLLRNSVLRHMGSHIGAWFSRWTKEGGVCCSWRMGQSSKNKFLKHRSIMMLLSQSPCMFALQILFHMTARHHWCDCSGWKWRSHRLVTCFIFCLLILPYIEVHSCNAIHQMHNQLNLTPENVFQLSVLGDCTVCKWKSISCQLEAVCLVYHIYKGFVLMIIQFRDYSMHCGESICWSRFQFDFILLLSCVMTRDRVECERSRTRSGLDCFTPVLMANVESVVDRTWIEMIWRL